MDFTFQCDKCGQRLSIDEAGAGALVLCPNCSHGISVPSSQQASTSTPQSSCGQSENQFPANEEQKEEKAKLADLVRDCHRTTPLVPGCVTASLILDPQTEKPYDFDLTGLSEFNRCSFKDLLRSFCGPGELTEAQVEAVQTAVEAFNTASIAMEEVPEKRARFFDYSRLAASRVIHSASAWALFCQLVGIITPSEKTFRQTENGEEDLVESLRLWFRVIAEGVWSKFVPYYLNPRRSYGVWVLAFWPLTEEPEDLIKRAAEAVALNRHGAENLSSADQLLKSYERGQENIQKGLAD